MTRRRLLIIAVLPAILIAIGLALWVFLPIQTEATIRRLLPWFVPFPKQPYVQNAGPTAMTILYETNAPGQGVVKYSAGEQLDQTAPAELRQEIHHDIAVTYLYGARLESLTPQASYKYRVEHAVEGKKPIESRTAVFRTWPDGGAAATFIVYGDSRSSPEGHAVMARRFEQYQPDFIIHTGDAVTSGRSYWQWQCQFFDPLEATLGATPLFMVRGNHDGPAEQTLRWFDLPGGRTWYSFTCGPVHVAVLDCYEDTPEVARWLDQDLAASQSPWKIVAYHEPTFNFGVHRSSWGRDLLPIFAKHHVDVVFAGHSHQYERFLPLRLGADGSHATTFITTGGGGAPLYPVVQHPLLAAAESVHHYGVVEIADGRLTMRALTPKGREIDRWTVAKINGRLDPEYLGLAQPVESAIQAQELIRAAEESKPVTSDAGGHR